MNLDTLKSLAWWLFIGAMFFLMMRRGGCGMMLGAGHAGSRERDDGDGHPPRSASGRPLDPVCGMEVEPARAAGTRIVEGRTFFFCSPMCLETFDKNQAVYLHAGHGEAGHRHQHTGC